MISSEFKSRFKILLSGTVIAQLIPVLAMPFLTRLFTPEDFGQLAIYMAIVQIFGSVATFRYELAIMWPESDAEANNVFHLSMIISIFIGIIAGLLVYFSNSLLKLDTNILTMSLLVSLGVSFTGFYMSLSYWMSRRGDFSQLAKVKIFQSSLVVCIQLATAIFSKIKYGLIIGNFLGLGGAVLCLLNKSKKDIFFRSDISDVIGSSKKYYKNMIYSSLSALFDSLSLQATVIVTSFLFSQTILGFYNVINKAVRLPLGFVFSALSQVYYKESSLLVNEKPDELLSLTRTIQRKIALVLAPYCILVTVMSPFLFGIVFGDQWEEAGKLVKYFIPLVFFNGLYSPISTISETLREQKFVFYFHLSLSVTSLVCFYLASLFYEFEISLLVLSIIGSLHYIFVDRYMKFQIKKLIK